MFLCVYQGFVLNFMTLKYIYLIVNQAFIPKLKMCIFFQVPGNFHVSTHGAGNQVILLEIPSAIKSPLLQNLSKPV